MTLLCFGFNVRPLSLSLSLSRHTTDPGVPFHDTCVATNPTQAASDNNVTAATATTVTTATTTKTVTTTTTTAVTTSKPQFISSGTVSILRDHSHVLFAGWASFITITSSGKLEVHGMLCSTEKALLDILTYQVTISSHNPSSPPSVKLFGWESLQGFLSLSAGSGNVYRINDLPSISPCFVDAHDIAAAGPSSDHTTVVIQKSTRQLFIWTLSNPEPTPLIIPSSSSSLSSLKFERVWAGEGHFLALTTDCVLYSWGSGRHGQLGHGNVLSEDLPKCIEALEGIRIIDAACGGSFSMALSDIRDVYTFGLNDYGQLGLGDTVDNSRNNAYPQLVDFYASEASFRSESAIDVNIVQVACGQAHAVCLDDNGNVWSCGWGKYGQLEPKGLLNAEGGVEDWDINVKPTENNSKVKLTESKLVSSRDRSFFQQVSFPPVKDHPPRWKNVKCGRWSTFLLSSESLAEN
ncbi:hypothetical protein BGZ94_006186 [Podila epigama]|nr:hypothetical protein BGZ94_006186 [Podila epigama]